MNSGTRIVKALAVRECGRIPLRLIREPERFSRATAGPMAVRAGALHSSRMSPHWSVYVAGGCSIALAIAIVVMLLLT